MTNPPDRVLVWQSEFAANAFPPVCAMTGAPAETWRKFTFTRTPAWSYLGGLLIAAALAERTTGYLPLTRASARNLQLARWIFVGLFPLAFLFWIGGLFVAPGDQYDPTRNAISLFLFVLGFVALIAALVGRIVRRQALGPSGKILKRQPGHVESLIELRNVHHAFVTAVQQLQHSRAQTAYQAQSPIP